jgi:hypothetical protein
MSDFAEELAQIGLRELASRQPGAFYGRADTLAPGAGVIYTGITYAHFNAQEGRFEARRGMVLILTHECDIDPANDRDFNENFVFAPLIPLAALATEYERLSRKDAAKSLVVETARDKVNRLLFLPPVSTEHIDAPQLSLGALIFWNWLGNTHVTQLKSEGVKALCALSEHGMTIADRRFQEHFLRPKSERLPQVT